MTADNPGALVPVFQGNDGIHQSILRSFRACLALPALHTAQMQGRRKKQFTLSLALRCCDIRMQM